MYIFRLCLNGASRINRKLKGYRNSSFLERNRADNRYVYSWYWLCMYSRTINSFVYQKDQIIQSSLFIGERTGYRESSFTNGFDSRKNASGSKKALSFRPDDLRDRFCWALSAMLLTQTQGNTPNSAWWWWKYFVMLQVSVLRITISGLYWGSDNIRELYTG